MDFPRFFGLYALLDSKYRQTKFAAWLRTRIGKRRQHLLLILEGNAGNPAEFQQHAEKVLIESRIGWSILQYHRELSYLCKFLEDFLLIDYLEGKPLLKRMLLAEMFGDSNDTANLHYIQKQLSEQLATPAPALSVFEQFQQLQSKRWILQYKIISSKNSVNDINDITYHTDKFIQLLALQHQAVVESWKRQQKESGIERQNAYTALSLDKVISEDPDISNMQMIVEMAKTDTPTHAQIVAWQQAFEAWTSVLSEIERKQLPEHQQLYSATVRYRNSQMTPEANSLLWGVVKNSITRGYDLHRGQIRPVSWPGVIKVAASVISFEEFKKWYNDNNLQRLMPNGMDGLALAQLFYDWEISLKDSSSAEGIAACRRIINSILTLGYVNKQLAYRLRILSFKAQLNLELSGAAEIDTEHALRQLRALKQGVLEDSEIFKNIQEYLILEIEILSNIFKKNNYNKWDKLQQIAASAQGISDKAWYLSHINALGAAAAKQQPQTPGHPGN